MQCEEAGQRGAGNDGTAQHEMDKLAPDKRNAAHDRSPDAQAPIGVLIEAQHLPGEGHAQRHQQQKDAQNPGKLARKLVCAEQEDLAMWMSTMATMKFDPQPCMPRRNQPRGN